MKKKDKQFWSFVLIVTFLLGSFLFNKSFVDTFVLRKAITKAHLEVKSLVLKKNQLHEKVKKLKQDPSTYEPLVRESLGYLRPDEKEVKFLRKKNSSKN